MINSRANFNFASIENNAKVIACSSHVPQCPPNNILNKQTRVQISFINHFSYRIYGFQNQIPLNMLQLTLEQSQDILKKIIIIIGVSTLDIPLYLIQKE